MLLVRANERGISLIDFERMTMGMILDYIITYNNLNISEEDKEESIREANQNDFDSF